MTASCSNTQQTGDLNSYITTHPTTSLDQRLRWCQQAAEAVSYIHSKRVIHCDINLRNLLLDANLDLKLADFQGMHKAPDGRVLLDGLSRECTKSFMPRAHGDHAGVETDLFALGSAVYFIMMGHEVFPDLDGERDEGEVVRRFRAGEVPVDGNMCAAIARRCWTGEYGSAKEVVDDIRVVREGIASTLTDDVRSVG